MLTDEEQEALNRLLSGCSSVAEALRLYSSLTARGIPFQMEWEEKVLELCLADEPNRADLLGRYRVVLRSLGKSIPDDIDQRYATAARIQERDTNHQRAAAEYDEKTGFEDTEPDFRLLVDKVKSYTMTSVARMYALYKAIDYIVRAGIPGDIVECGVWRGGSMMLAAIAMLDRNSTDRNLYLFDTYEGLPRPDEQLDVDIWGNRAINGWLPNQIGDESSHWAAASLDEVRGNLLSTGYPEERIHFVKGMVERTIPAEAPQAISLLRLDTDWYASTKHELEYLFPRLAPRGVLLIDDYGHFTGARKAVDDYLACNKLAVLLNRIDYAGRLVIKPG